MAIIFDHNSDVTVEKSDSFGTPLSLSSPQMRFGTPRHLAITVRSPTKGILHTSRK